MRESYSQAQNTRAEVVLQPDWLQHVSDELQLNTHRNAHTHTHTHVRAQGMYNKLYILHYTSILSEQITTYFLLWQCFLDGDVHLFYDAFPLSLLYPTSHFRFKQIRATQWEHLFHHVHTRPHHCTTHLSAHRITWTHLTLLKRACCNTHSISTNDHSVSFCKITGSFCFFHILCTSGKPQLAPLNADSNVLHWPQFQ